MKEKRIPQSWHDKIKQKMSERESELVSHPSFYFTPGVPTEDGWYVVKTSTNDYTTMQIRSGKWLDYSPAFILSHAKLPEL